MNKKILLVSLLAVGMLVGCNHKDPKPSSSLEPSSSPVSENTSGNASSENSESLSESSTTPLEMGEFGPKGYYLVGEMNGWNNFWKFEGYQDFLFTLVSENVYTLTYSVTADFLASEDVAGDTKDAVDFKVMYWDGDKAPSMWYPDGVGNNGVITEAGEYKFTFTLNSKDVGTKEDGSTYTLYTKAEKIGDANPETAFVKGEARAFDPAYGQVTYKVAVEEGVTIPEGNSIFIHTWGLTNEAGEDVSGYFKMTEGANGVWSYQTTGEVETDDGTGVGKDLGFCIIVDSNDATEQDWTKKVTNSLSTDGNYSIHVSEFKLSGTATLNLSDKPYWTKGDRTNPYTVGELYEIMSSADYVAGTNYAVTGVVKSVVEGSFPNPTFGSYSFFLEVPVPEVEATAEGETTTETPAATYEFEIYSAKLGEGVIVPEVGSIVCVEGKSKIYTKEGQLPIYELAYDKASDNSPVIYSVTTYSEYYVKGSMNEWAANDLYRLTKNADGNYEITVNLAADAEFKLANADWSKEVGPSALTVPDTLADAFDLTGANIKVVTAGTYTFVIDATSETPTATVSVAA